jgi:hypothetical protein
MKRNLGIFNRVIQKEQWKAELAVYITESPLAQ